MEHLNSTPPNKLAAPNAPGSGWSLGLNSGGYLTPAYHFYPKGELRSACQGRMRRARVPVPGGQLSPTARKCKACHEWTLTHPNGGTRNNTRKNPL